MATATAPSATAATVRTRVTRLATVRTRPSGRTWGRGWRSSERGHASTVAGTGRRGSARGAAADRYPGTELSAGRGQRRPRRPDWSRDPRTVAPARPARRAPGGLRGGRRRHGPVHADVGRGRERDATRGSRRCSSRSRCSLSLPRREWRAPALAAGAAVVAALHPRRRLPVAGGGRAGLRLRRRGPAGPGPGSAGSVASPGRWSRCSCSSSSPTSRRSWRLRRRRARTAAPDVDAQRSELDGRGRGAARTRPPGSSSAPRWPASCTTWSATTSRRWSCRPRPGRSATRRRRCARSASWADGARRAGLAGRAPARPGAPLTVSAPPRLLDIDELLAAPLRRPAVDVDVAARRRPRARRRRRAHASTGSRRRR